MGIQISGLNGVDKIVATDGTIDVLSGSNFSGVVTATSFAGNLTGNLTGNVVGDVTGNLTGNVNATSNLLLQIGGSEKFRVASSGQLGIGGANYGTSGQVLTSGGSGSAATWSTVSGTTINNNADNRVITGSGTANTLEGEANLTFSSNQLTVHEAKLKGNQLLFTTSGTAYLDHSTVGQDIQVRVSTSSSQDTTGPTFKSNGNLAFASGKGIDFSATADGSGSSQAEILDDYEEGSWTPAVASGNASFSTMTGRYTKIGNQVTLWFKIAGGGSYSGSGTLRISGIPFTNNTPSIALGNSEYYKVNFASGYSDHVTPYLNGNEVLWLRNNSGNGSGNYLTVNLFYNSASINTVLTYMSGQ